VGAANGSKPREVLEKQNKRIMNIYLGVDGTLIHDDLANYNQPALRLRQFFEALLPYPVYWFTTYCRDGDSIPVRLRLSKMLAPEIFLYILRYKPTT
jgi:hypothetical protein